MIPNLSEATLSQQARGDSRDFDIINVAGLNTGVLSGGVVSPGTGLTVNVSAASILVSSVPVPAVGAVTNLTITTADATNPRIDLVVVSGTGAVSVIAGTPAAVTSTSGPVMPSRASIGVDSNGNINKVVLARVDVRAGATSILSTDIIDKRQWLPPRSTYVPVPTGVAATDTANIQAAITNSAQGDSIVFQKGTYVVTPPIVFLPFRRYTGQGSGNTTIQASPGTLNNANTGVFEAWNYTNNQLFSDSPVAFENMRFDANTGVRWVNDIIGNGTTTITSASAAFTAADVGASIVQGVGTNIPGGTTIISQTGTAAVCSATVTSGTTIGAIITRTTTLGNTAGWAFICENYWSTYRSCEFANGPSGGVRFTDKGKSVGRATSADGHQTIGSPILTSATAAFVQGDVGNVLTSSVAGVTGTILSVQSSTQCTMTANVATNTSTVAVFTLANANITNTTVESRWEDCRFTNNLGPHFQTDNFAGGVTDGFLLNNAFNGGGYGGAAGAGGASILMNNIAGWVLDGNNLYNCSGHAIQCFNAYGTTISNSYIEDFGSKTTNTAFACGIYCQAVSGRHSQIHDNHLYVTTTPNASGQYAGVIVYGTQVGVVASVNNNIMLGTGAATYLGAVYLTHTGSGTLLATAAGNMVTSCPAGLEVVIDANVTPQPFNVCGDISPNDNSHYVGNLATAVTAAAGVNAGSSPPSPVITGCTDCRGTLTFGTGTSPAAGAMVVVTFGKAYAATPIVVLSKGNNSATRTLDLYVSAKSTTAFTVTANTAPSASQANTVYSFDYIVMG